MRVLPVISRGLLIAAFALLMSACERSPAGPAGAGCEQPGPPVLGLGCVDERFTSELSVSGDWAYTGTWGRRRQNGSPGNALKVWNVAGPAPLLTDSIIVDDAVTLGDVQVSDDGSLLVVATEYEPGSIVLYDLADPASPRLLSRFASASTYPGVHTAEVARVNGRLYAFLSVNPGAAPATLVIVDLADPAAPREVFAEAMGRPFVHDVFVRHGLLFIALWHDGLTIWDVGGAGLGGSPEAPVRIGNVQTVGGSVHNVWWFHDPSDGTRRYAFVGEEVPGVFGNSSAGDIHVVDISDPADPREVAFYSVAGAGAHNFWVDEAAGILYAAYYNGGVRALDVRGDLSACADDVRAPDGRCDLAAMGRERATLLADLDRPVYVWGVQLAGGHLYASDMLNGLWKLDISSLQR